MFFKGLTLLTVFLCFAVNAQSGEEIGQGDNFQFIPTNCLNTISESIVAIREGHSKSEDYILQVIDEWIIDALNSEYKGSRKQSLHLLYSVLSGGRLLKEEGCLSIEKVKPLLVQSRIDDFKPLGTSLSLKYRLKIAQKVVEGVQKAEGQNNVTHITSLMALLPLAFADSYNEQVIKLFLNAQYLIQNDKVKRTLINVIYRMYTQFK